MFYLRFMSPFSAREKMLDRFPPGQQPQINTVRVSICPRPKRLARQKAVRGMMPNWATTAIATPFGLKTWALILATSMVQPRDTIVMKRMMTVKPLMALSIVGEKGFWKPLLPL